MKRGLSTVVSREVKQFSDAMGEWWDPEGPARALHQLNPLRTRFVREFAADCWGAREGPYPLEGLSVLDVGCGGGLLSEALARLGGAVTGLDASERAVEVASGRAARLTPTLQCGSLRYRAASPEQLAGEQFDLVVASEVLEHVADPDEFVGLLAGLSRRGVVVSTLNRTAKSYLAAVVGAEYLLGLVPPGTHDWDRFVTPPELVSAFREGGMTMVRASGMRYNPWLRPYWSLAPSDLDINYIAAFRRH
jgi:ubiquinone biosynthesis O-methyltransferase